MARRPCSPPSRPPLLPPSSPGLVAVPLRRVSAAEARDAAEAEASKLESKPPPNNAGCEAIDEATGRGDEPDEDALLETVAVTEPDTLALAEGD